MNERLSESTEHDDATEERIAYMMDTRGYSRADAQYVLDGHIGDAGVVTPVPYEESVRQHPAAAAKRPRARYSRPAVGEDSQDVFTGYIDPEQAKINSRGAALVREIFRVDQTELTPHERAIARAKLEKREARKF